MRDINIFGPARTCRISGIPGEEAGEVKFYTGPTSPIGQKPSEKMPVTREEVDALEAKIERLTEALVFVLTAGAITAGATVTAEQLDTWLADAKLDVAGRQDTAFAKLREQLW